MGDGGVVIEIVCTDIDADPAEGCFHDSQAVADGIDIRHIIADIDFSVLPEYFSCGRDEKR